MLSPEVADWLRRNPNSPTFWGAHAAAGVETITDAILRRRTAELRKLSGRELRKLDLLWDQLCAAAAFVFPREQERARLAQAARALIAGQVDPELAAQLLEAFAISSGLHPSAVPEAIAAARSAA